MQSSLESSNRHLKRMEAAMSVQDAPKRSSQINKARSSSIYRASAASQAPMDLEQLVKPHYTMADVEAFRDSFNYVHVGVEHHARFTGGFDGAGLSQTLRAELARGSGARP